MTPAQEAAAQRRRENAERLIAGFYESGGWTEERRARLLAILGDTAHRPAATPANSADAATAA